MLQNVNISFDAERNSLEWSKFESLIEILRSLLLFS